MTPARHLFAKWGPVSERLRAARRIALFLDFDGTLTPLRRRPEDVRLSMDMRRVITVLHRNPRFRVFVVSGRRQADVRAHMRIPGVRYLGLHGWEGRRTAEVNPETRALLHGVKTQATRLARGVPGAWVEDKGAVVTIHYAEAAAPDIGRIRAELSKWVDGAGTRLRGFSGERSFELVPAEVEDKGAAVRREWICVSRAALPVFIGDDVVDEPAFAVLSQGITVRVGRPVSTHAHYRLSDVMEVRAFLERLNSATSPTLA